MTTPRRERLLGAFGWSATGHRDAPADLATRLLCAIGADRGFADDVIGDLAQEREWRTVTDGPVAAAWWYWIQALRAAPHLAWNGVRHGARPDVSRIASIVALVALGPAVLFVVFFTSVGAPARLVVEGQRGRNAAEGLIVNTVHPVRLAARAFDAGGHPLGGETVHYRWTGGVPLDVSDKGVVTCSENGDAMLRVSAGHASTPIVVQCRPVRWLRSPSWIPLVVGESAHDYPFEAYGPDGERVGLLAGERIVHDNGVARLLGNQLVPLAPGHTTVSIRMGDATSHTEVSVFEPVASLDHLRPDQGFVIAPVHVTRGDTIHWSLPPGSFWLTYHRVDEHEPVPHMAVSGPIRCAPSFGATVTRVACVALMPGGMIHIAAPANTPVITGRISLERPSFIKL